MRRPTKAAVTVETANRVCAITAREEARVCHQNLVEIVRRTSGDDLALPHALMIRAAALYTDLMRYHASLPVSA